MKKTYSKYDLLRTCFSRILATDKKTNIVQNIFLTEQTFLNKITTGCLWNISFLEVCIHLIADFASKVQALKESRVYTMESFSFELIEAIVHKCSKEGVFEILEELIRNHPQPNTTSDNRV